MILPRKALSAYDKRLAALEGKAYEYASSRISAFIEKFPGAKPEQVREFAIEVVDDSVGAFGDGASSLAADMYEGMAELSGVKVKPAVIDTSDVHGHIESEVRYQLGKYLSGDPQGFIRACGSKASDQVARRANQTMRLNAKRDGLRYARVPMGGETCSFCAMLASRGFDYKSAKTAGEGNHYHKNCRCKVIPGFDGMEVEGYDPDEWHERWQAFREIDDASGLSVKARQAAKEFLSAVSITDGDGTAKAVAIALSRAKADTYGEKMDKAWKKFKKNKTPENYQETVGAALAEIGAKGSIKISGSYAVNAAGTYVYANPNGDEIWAALSLSGIENSVKFLPSDRSVFPDVEIDGGYVEIKTPSTTGKIARRLSHAAKQLSAVNAERKEVVLSLLRLDDIDDALEISHRFVDDGTIDSIIVIHRDGTIERIRKSGGTGLGS